MAKEAKASKVSVQRNPIQADQPTMKNMSRREIDAQDMARNALKNTGMKCHLMTPKQ
jgi:hypothetical protein